MAIAGKPGGQFHQLTMFETAEDLRNGAVGKFLPADLDIDDEYYDEDGEFVEQRRESVDEGWERKSEEADMSGLTEHIAAHGGVERPVDLSVGGWRAGHEVGTIMNGHHRIAGAHDVNPKSLLPVNWTERQTPGSEGRKLYMGQRTGEIKGPKWSHEDEDKIGYSKDYY